MLGICLYGCAGQYFDGVPTPDKFQSEDSHKVTIEDAAKIADSFKEIKSRSKTYTLDYITAQSNVGQIDTLAYVFNYDEENGFIIISADDRASSILAYSDDGNFSYEENSQDIVYANFVSSLIPYFDNVKSDDSELDYSSEGGTGNISGAFVNPILIMDMGQHAPFDKYVQLNHPGCPVGCVAVATCQIMLHCKDNLTYHEKGYDFDGIRQAIMDSIPDQTISPQSTNFDIREYITYKMAVDRLAKSFKT